MSDKYTGKTKELKNDETAFSIIDTSKVLTESTIVLPVVHHILRPDEWLILRSVDWFQSLISALLGSWIIGLISVIIKLLVEHKSNDKIEILEMIEFYVVVVLFFLWLMGVILYNLRINQKWKYTQIDRQFLVDYIDSKLRLKFKKNGKY